MVSKIILKPGLKLIGAKTKIRQKLYDLFPKDYDRYVEPFLGTGGVLIGADPVRKEFAFDINQHVINYYRILQDNPEAFLDRLFFELRKDRDKADFERYKTGAVHDWSSVYKAVSFYIVTKTCMNGLWRLNKKGECNSSYCGTFTGRGFFTEEWFWQVVKRIKNVRFNVQHYVNTLGQQYSKSTFIFADPPYRNCKTTYNGISFSDEEHVMLQTLLSYQKCNWMVTINDDEFTRKLYKQYNIYTHDVNYSCSQTNAGRGKKPELIITNY